jgi:hypothetical protein
MKLRPVYAVLEREVLRWSANAPDWFPPWCGR